MNKKGYIAPLAMALIVIAGFFLLMTIFPGLRETVWGTLKIIFGG